MGRTYHVNGQDLPSVTTIVGCLAKPALENWMVGLAMDAAEECAGDREKAKALFGERRFEKANIGTRVHEMVAEHLQGFPLPADGELGPFEGPWLDFLEFHDVRPLMVETVVVHPRYGYAGRLDAIVELDGVPTLLDVKTGRLYASVALQLAAYRFADFALPNYPDCALPSPVPEVERCAVLALRPRSWRLIDVEAGERELNDFRYLAMGHRIGLAYDRPL